MPGSGHVPDGDRGDVEVTATRPCGGTATVLVVEDEPALAQLYVDWLETAYTVRAATGGREALEVLDESVDVVFLDRHMPDLDGDEVLASIGDRAVDPRVVMVTAVRPAFDILEMGFDDYLTKPVDGDELVGAVETMLERERYDDTLREYFSLAAKRATLEVEQPRAELAGNDAYQRLTTRVEELKNRADGALVGLESEYETLFRDVTTGRSAGGRWPHAHD